MQVKCYKCGHIFDLENSEEGKEPDKFNCPNCHALLKVFNQSYKKDEKGDSKPEESDPIDKALSSIFEPDSEEGKIVEEDKPQPSVLPPIAPPWEVARGLELLTAWFSTLRLSIFNGRDLFAFMPRTEGKGIGNFGYSIWFLGIAINAAITAYFFHSSAAAEMWNQIDIANKPSLQFMEKFSLTWFIASPVLALVFFYGSIGLYHVNLIFFRANGGGFYATFRAVVYGSWPILLLVFPAYIFVVAAIAGCFITHSRALAILHGVSLIKTSFAVLLAWLVGFYMFVVVMAVILRFYGVDATAISLNPS